MKKGYIAAFSVYLFWGLSPLYWKLISSIPALEVLGMRVLWSVPFLFILYSVRGQVGVFNSLFRDFKNIKPYLLSAFLIAANWLTWIWAVNNNYVVAASLGYFINPLVNVVLGVFLLHEKMRRLQWLAIFMALAGVLYLTINYGQFPWIALTLAGTFSVYGYIRKTAPLGAIDGLNMEVFILTIPAILLLSFLNISTNIVLLEISPFTHFILAFTGLITVVPLVVFGYGARKIPYSTLGFIQYIAPTLQFLLGVFLYNEEFSRERLIGFSFIWLALIIYTAENIYVLKRKKLKLSSI